jgi:hypothetical protein
MSRLFESFEFLDRGWDIRILEGHSTRTLVLALIPSLFMLGMLTSAMLYSVFRLHRFNWAMAMLLPLICISAIRYSRLIYRRLDH